MPAPFNFVLFYKPPCGKWYVHSHKLYSDDAAANEAAVQFLPSGTPIAVVPILPDFLDTQMRKVP